MGLHSEANLNRRFIETARQINLYLNHFPRHEKYALAQQIRNALYDVYALIVEAQKRYHKKTTLTNLDIRHEQLRMFVNLAHSLGYFQYRDGQPSVEYPEEEAVRRHLVLSRMIDELGRMIGGWLKLESGEKEQ
ncbi:MAG: four helix bundle protein [Gammaproteobacteria bacterium]|nr:four helix bundle protein [Gammaproteobacteria bacterium]